MTPYASASGTIDSDHPTFPRITAGIDLVALEVAIPIGIQLAPFGFSFVHYLCDLDQPWAYHANGSRIA